nr:MAG TPA_asm: hypothetical protein [Caudoviricetes sp.]
MLFACRRSMVWLRYIRLSVGQKEVSKTSNESSMLSGRAYPYLRLVGCYCNSSGRWETYGW